MQMQAHLHALIPQVHLLPRPEKLMPRLASLVPRLASLIPQVELGLEEGGVANLVAADGALGAAAPPAISFLQRSGASRLARDQTSTSQTQPPTPSQA